MAIRGIFNPAASLLSIFGDNADNFLLVSRDAAGKILVNGGAVPVLGGTPTVANTTQITIFGQGGNDTITIDETNGAMPKAQIFAGAGNDVATGGSGNDLIFGQAGNDTLLGKGGFDLLFGGEGNDVLTGGDADDQMFGEGGDDRMIWNPGDDNDLMEGGAGTDTAEVNGGNGGEVFTATANGTRVRFDRVTPAPFAIDIGTTENLVVNMNGGDDTFSATGNLAALIKVTVDGGAGNDTIRGGNGNDFLLGGSGDDFIDGNQGNDTAFLGEGEDVFQWDPGDGSDIVEGQDGFDTMLFNGANIGEVMQLSANGGRSLFTRNVANITMDLNSVEQVTVNALGGADQITINDTTGTDVQAVNVNLAGTIGGVAGDGAADTVTVNATNGEDFVDVLGTAGDMLVLGLNAAVFVADAEAANDSLVVNLLGGDDTISASGVAVGNVKLTIDGGTGDDTITGSQADDVLIGGEGDDFITGGRGNDVVLLGAGDDIATWDPGEGSDIVEGGTGRDVLRFIGANINEKFDISANGGRVLIGDVANITMDLNGVEKIDLLMFGGADTLTIGDLSGTDVTEVAVNLGAVLGSPQTDAAADTVAVTGTQGIDQIVITGLAGSATVNVDGLHTDVTLTRAEVGLDTLVINALGGDDVINASGLKAGVIGLQMNGGLGADLFIGSEGRDVIFGGDGNDTALMGKGDDTFVWNPGDDNDVVEGQDGFDEMLFNGANIGEVIDIFANGGRAVFTRNVANVTMDLNDVEKITFNALGGADNIKVNDLSGTDVQLVSINLGASGGVDDGAGDTVTIDGTNGDDVIQIFGASDGVHVVGLSEEVLIFNFGVGDRLVINGLNGSDVIEASGLDVGIQLVVNGGEGDDVIVGGAGDDVLFGDGGDDVLIGGPGIDVLVGGLGDNVLIQG